MAMEGSDSPGVPARSPRWIAPLAVVAVAALLLILFLPFLSAPLFVLFLILILAALALWRPMQRYSRLILLAVVPGLAVADVVATFLSEAMNSIEAQAFMRGAVMRLVVGGLGGRLAWSIFLGLLAGIGFVWLLQETYILYNKDIVMGFTDADEATTRRALRALFLNMQWPYMVVEDDGRITTSKPAGVMKKIGGPGTVIISAGQCRHLRARRQDQWHTDERCLPHREVRAHPQDRPTEQSGQPRRIHALRTGQSSRKEAFQRAQRLDEGQDLTRHRSAGVLQRQAQTFVRIGSIPQAGPQLHDEDGQAFPARAVPRRHRGHLPGGVFSQQLGSGRAPDRHRPSA